MGNKKRRGHNEGSIYYLESRERWVVEITVSIGERKKFYCKTRQEAVRKKAEVLRELEQGTLAIAKQRKLGEYLNDWLENIHKNSVRLNTYLNYQRCIKHIMADLGDVWLHKLTPKQVQDFYAKKLQEGLSSKYVHNIHGVLSVALEKAVRWKIISQNVCTLVDPPRIDKPDLVVLTVGQVFTLLGQARGHRLEVLLLMAIITGMRRGELLALRWSDIDFELGRLVVLRTVSYIAKYGYVEGEPKTRSGKRAIELPGFLLAVLKKHQTEQAALRGNVEQWEERGLVFFTGRYGPKAA